jgi:arylsulfatase A-like enzyme
MGVADETLIVITGDHGETLYDHDVFFDHHGLYEPTLVVPLVYYWPGRVPEGRRINAYSLHEDMIPTVLDICGLKDYAKRTKFDGVSLVPYFSKPNETPRSEFYISECTWMRKHGWRTPIWKFWDALEPDFHGKPPVELYNILEDPEEANNLADKHPDIVKMLRGRMKAWIEKRCKETGKGSPILDHKLGLGKHIGSIATAKKLQSR